MKRNNTEKDFITAFWKLYSAKPIEKIPVTLLCRTAGYNRATFYHHFDNIYDLLDQAVDELFAPVRDEIFATEDFHSLLHGNMIETILLSRFQKQDQYIELLFRRGNYDLLGEKIKHVILSAVPFSQTNHKMLEIILEYQISAVLGVVKYWFQNDRPVSEQIMLKKLYDISSKGALNSLREELAQIHSDNRK